MIGRVMRASWPAWLIGGLFAIGSLCFAVASVPAFVDATSEQTAARTFFTGSLFFTSAALGQLLQALRSRDGRWPAAIQFAGTILFNISTFAATQADLDLTREKRLIWAPDLYGSICFLAASWLAYRAAARGTGWWIAVVNLAGSVAFGASAVGARYVGSTGSVANVDLVNAGTFLGAVCFFAGAVLLPVDARSPSHSKI
jgi:hypothetical protein